MKNYLRSPLVFFAGLIAGLLAAAIFWESTKPFPELRVAPLAPEWENFEELSPESPPGYVYDQARYDELNSVLKFIIKNKKGEDDDILMPFDQVSNLLSLENAAWDDSSVDNFPDSQLRMYHFRGFCLFLYLEKRIPGDPDSFSPEDMRNKGVIYVSGLPSVQIDGLDDPRERARLHRKAVAEFAGSFSKDSQKQEK